MYIYTYIHACIKFLLMYMCACIKPKFGGVEGKGRFGATNSRRKSMCIIYVIIGTYR